MIKLVSYILYRFFAFYLPSSSTPYIGFLFKKIRYFLCKNLFLHCGKNVNIEHGAKFGRGSKISIGDNSGIGVNCIVPSDIKIGCNVMMGPECLIYSANHRFDSIYVPMIQQGHYPRQSVILGDDIWIGGRVIILPGKVIGNGVIIGAGSVVTKDCLNYGIYGGNPSRLIKFRNE